MSKPRTYVYIDGYNFYYGVVKGTQYKWLNFRVLCERMLPKNHVIHIKYFTAKAEPESNDPNIPQRQETYWNALRTLPGFEIIKGYFRYRLIGVKLDKDIPGSSFNKGDRIHGWKWEEKGSDVNLAVHLLNDAWENKFDVAVILSNDADLVGAIKIVKERLGKTVCIVNPKIKKALNDPSAIKKEKARPAVKALYDLCDFQIRISRANVEKSLFPDHIPNTNLYKPHGW